MRTEPIWKNNLNDINWAKSAKKRSKALDEPESLGHALRVGLGILLLIYAIAFIVFSV